jgi:hypothetical protein
MQSTSGGRRWNWKKATDFSSWMHAMHSMRKVGQQCFGLSDRNGAQEFRLFPSPKDHPAQTNNPDATINPPVDDPTNDGDRGDILFRGLWKNQHKTIRIKFP